MLQEEFAAPVIETYNCSEAGQLAGGLLSWAEKESGVSPMAASGDAAVMDEDGHLLGRGETGEIVARGDGVISHYLDNTELTADSFCNGWFHTGDLGSIDRDGFLRIKGRIKEIIDYGGESISPEEIDGVLSAHPEVETAVSFAIPHPSLGQQVAAAVVLGAGARATESDLKRYLRVRLAHFKVPRKIILMDAIPVGPTGKVLRNKLVTQIKDADRYADGDQAPKQGPRTPLERTLVDLWRHQLKRNDIGVDDDFFLLGGDSLQAIDLFLRIEKELGKVLPRSTLLEASTIGELARAIESTRASDSLVPINPAGSLPPLNCVHDGSGQVLLFRHLSRHLGGEQPFYGLQAHGIDGKAPFHMSVERMAADYVESIRCHQPKGPYYLAGYSFGGQVAFEMAHQLLSAGEHVALLVLLDSHLFGPGSRVSTGKWLRRHIKRFARLKRGERLPYLKKRVVNAAEIATGFVRKPIIARALERGARGRSLSPDRFWDIAAYASHRYRPPVIDCRTVLFRTQLYAWSHHSVHTGWNDLVEHGVEMIKVPGHHSEFLEEPHVRQVAAELRDQIRHAREASSRVEED
jgi:thioesterase domain-containing protein/acyl carrier protein